MNVKVKCKKKHLYHLGYFNTGDGWVKYLDYSPYVAERIHWQNGKIHIDAIRKDNKWHFVRNNKFAYELLNKEKDFLESEALKFKEEKKTKQKSLLAPNLSEIQKMNLNPKISNWHRLKRTVDNFLARLI